MYVVDLFAKTLIIVGVATAAFGLTATFNSPDRWSGKYMTIATFGIVLMMMAIVYILVTGEQ